MMKVNVANACVNTTYHVVQSRHVAHRDIKKYFDVAKKIAFDSTASCAISALSVHVGMLMPYQVAVQTILSSADSIVEKKDRAGMLAKLPFVIAASCVDVANDDITTAIQNAVHLGGCEAIHAAIQAVLFFLSTTMTVL
jgi:hypothetical protein